MKKNHFWQSALFASALLFGFSACSSDDNGAPQQNTNQERTLTIALNTGETSAMRSTTINSNPTDNGLEWAVIAIFDNSASNNTVKIELVDKGNTTTIGSYQKWPNSGNVITLAAQGLNTGYEVYVVANPQGAATTPTSGSVAANLLAAANKTEFLAVASSMAQTLQDETTTTKEKENNFLMVGKGTLAASSTTGIDYEAGTINLYRMAAKVGLTEATCDLSGTIYDGTAVQIKEIYLDNVPSSQNINLAANTDNSYTYATGLSTDPAAVAYLSTGALASPITLNTTDMTNDYFFYTMPNAENDKAKATRLVVKCDFGGTDVYYPIYLNYTWNSGTSAWEAASTAALPFTEWSWTTAREAKKVYPNDYYNITLAIKSVGVTDPDQDLDPQAVQVTVTVADWVTINQNATFTN